MLYQADRCKEWIRQRVVNQTTRSQEKNLTIVLTKKQNVLIIVLGSIRMCVKLRSKMFGSYIGRNKLIFWILTYVEW